MEEATTAKKLHDVLVYIREKVLEPEYVVYKANCREADLPERAKLFEALFPNEDVYNVSAPGERKSIEQQQKHVQTVIEKIGLEQSVLEELVFHVGDRNRSTHYIDRKQWKGPTGPAYVKKALISIQQGLAKEILPHHTMFPWKDKLDALLTLLISKIP